MKAKEFMKKNKKKILSAGAVLLLLLGYIGYSLVPDSVDVDSVTKGNIQGSISEVGYIEADDAMTIYSPVSGKISTVLVNSNDSIESGQVFATYDLLSFEEEVQVAAANKKYCSDGYSAAVSKNNEYKQMLNEAEAEGEANKQIYAGLLESRDTLLYTQEGRNQEIEYNLKKLEAQLASLSTELSVATADYESAVNSGNEKAAKEAKDRMAGFENSIKTNRTALVSYDTKSMTLEEYNVYLEVLRHLDLIDRFWSQNIEEKNIAKQGIVPDSQLAQYADSVEIAKVQETQANRNLEMAKGGLSVDYTGTVIERLIDPGAYVSVGTPLFVIQPTTGYKARVMVSRFDVDKVAVGQKAEIKIGGTTYEGVVDSISPVAEKDSSNKPKVKTYVKLNDASARPTIGLEADVNIYLEEKSNVLTVDDRAVYTGDLGSYVFVLEEGKVNRKYVTVGSKSNGRTEVLEGLSENEQAIVSHVSEEDIGSRRFAN